MGASAIICLGNRYLAGDDIGCRVFDHLNQAPRRPGVDLIDGGLCGLDLLSLMEGRERVVFADALAGPVATDRVVVQECSEVVAQASHYGHSAGLPYLLSMMRLVLAPPWPQVTLVGASGAAGERTLLALAERCMEIASRGCA